MRVDVPSDPQPEIEAGSAFTALEPDASRQPAEERSAPADGPGRPARAVLVLASTVPRGEGDSRPAFVLDLSRHLQPQFKVTILAPAVPDGQLGEELDGVEVRRFRYFWPRSWERLADGAILENLRRRRWLMLQVPFLFLFELIAAYRLAREMRPSVIHAHWFVPQGIVAVVVGRLLGIPAVVTAHGGDVAGLRGWPWSFLRGMVARWSAAVTVVSGDLKDRLAAELPPGGRSLAVMPMGVDTQRFEGGGLPSHKTVLFVGRLAEKKGLQHLLRAFPDVLASHPDARLVVVGDGPMRGELERLADALALGESVEFVGAQPSAEIARWYRKGRVCVLPSVVARSGDTEGLPVVLLEAMAAGRPVVAASVGGVPEVVVQGRTGLLVEPGSAQALAAAINELLDDPERARSIGEAGRLSIQERYDWRTVAEGYAGVLVDAAAKTRE